ncbi:MAG: ABC transporter permease [Blastocatellia bacterium]
MKRIIAQARKELTQLFRDRLTVALALVLPLILLVLYGKAISFSVTNVSIAVEDYDRSARSRSYIEMIAGSLTFRIISLPEHMTTEEALASETVRAAVIIPKDFERDLLLRRQAEVQWLIDATDTNTANILRGNASAITEAFTAQSSTSVRPAVEAEMRRYLIRRPQFRRSRPYVLFFRF